MTENQIILVERYYRYRVSLDDGNNRKVVEDNLSKVDAWLLHDWLHFSPCSSPLPIGSKSHQLEQQEKLSSKLEIFVPQTKEN